MICLVLTIFANLFPAGERRGPGRAGDQGAAGPDAPPRGPCSLRRRARAHLPGREARRRAAAARGRGGAALREEGLQAGGAEAGAGEGGAGGAGARAGGRQGSQAHPARPLPPQASEELLREHYAELRERPFYGRLLKYMGSGPVVAMVSAGHLAGGRAVPARADPAPARRCGRGWTSCAPRGRSSAPRTRPPPLPAPSAGISASRSASKAGPRDVLSPVPTSPAALRGPCPSSARAHARPSRAGT